MKFGRNFDFVKSKQSKLKQKSKFRFRHRNRNSEKWKHRNFDEIRKNICRNFDFNVSKKKYFRGNPS
jgi:hypothetical protein